MTRPPPTWQFPNPHRAAILIAQDANGYWSWNERIRDADGNSIAYNGGDSGDFSQNRAIALNNQQWQPGDEVILRALESDEKGTLWEITGGGDNCFNVVLTDKLRIVDGPNVYYKYSWIRVIGEVSTTAGTDITWTLTDQSGGPGNIPLFHLNRISLPVCGDQSPTEGMTAGDTVNPACVYRVCRGNGDWLEFGIPARWEHIVFTANPDPNGLVDAVILDWDQDPTLTPTEALLNGGVCKGIDMNAAVQG